MRLRLLAAACFLLAGVTVQQAAAAPVPNGASWTEHYITGPDPLLDPALHADVFLPIDAEPGERFPVILSIGPYFGTGAFGRALDGRVDLAPKGPIDRFLDMVEGGKIFERGYAYVQVDSRGYGGSDGCHDLGGPGEQRDAKRAVEWAASQSWSTGKVGMWGKSYDAWTQVMALAEKPEGLAAAVIQAPLIEAYSAFFMEGVHYEAGWYLTPSLYLGYDLQPQSPASTSAEELVLPAKGTATGPHCYAQNLTMTPIHERSLPYWRDRDIRAKAAESTVPVLWSHGFNDINTKPNNFMDVWANLKGPKRAWFGQWDHVRGNQADQVGRDGFLAEAMAWFDHHLKGMPLVEAPPVEVQDGEGKWRSEAAWPPADATPWPMPLKPGIYVDAYRNDAHDPRGGSWSVTTPTPHDLRIAGVPRVGATVSAAPGASMIGLLYDVDPDGRGVLITRGALRLSGSHEASFDLYPSDWILRAGHRLALQLSASDISHFTTVGTGTTVQVTSGSLSVPFLERNRTPDLEGRAAVAQSDVARPVLSPVTLRENTVAVTFPTPSD